MVQQWYNILCNCEGMFPRESETAGMAELADARDLKSRATKVAYRFETGFRHHLNIAG